MSGLVFRGIGDVLVLLILAGILLFVGLWFLENRRKWVESDERVRRRREEVEGKEDA